MPNRSTSQRTDWYNMLKSLKFAHAWPTWELGVVDLTVHYHRADPVLLCSKVLQQCLTGANI